MFKKLSVACAGITVLMLATGVAFAGVPCAGTSTVSATGNGDCAPGAAVCPAGDYDVVTVTVTVRDCYGNVLPGLEVEVYPNPALTEFCFCTGYESFTDTTDANGVVSGTFQYFGGCGNLDFYADCEGITLGPSTPINIASYDSNGDCTVNLTDFIAFAAMYLGTDPCGDYNCDGSVNLTDFIKFAAHYLHNCP